MDLIIVSLASFVLWTADTDAPCAYVDQEEDMHRKICIE